MKKSSIHKEVKHSNIIIRALKPENIDDFLKIELAAFYKKILFIFSGREEAAYSIVRSELVENLDTGRYYNAISDGKPVGTIELVTKENSEVFKRSFYQHYRYLGFFRTIKVYFLNFLDVPNLDSKTIYIDNVAVEENNRRKGIASKMLYFAESYAKENGKSVLKLWVAGKNNNAVALYKKIGFSELVKRSSRSAEKYFGYRDWVFMGKEI